MYLRQQQISQVLQKYSNKNEYCRNDMEEKDPEIGISVNSKNSKNNSRLRCLWQGIDIPNMAGKRFLELKMPPLHLFPRNVHPQKQHYIIDINASKYEAEFEYNDDSNYHKYYAHDVCDDNNTVEYSESQTYPADLQSYNSYSGNNTFSTSCNTGESDKLDQDVYHHTQITDEANQQCVPYQECVSYNTEMQNQQYNINPHHMQDYAHNIHGNWNDTNMDLGQEVYNDAQSKTHDMPSSSANYDYSINMPHNITDSSNSENQDRNISQYAQPGDKLDHSRMPSSIYANTATSYAEHREQPASHYETGSSFNHYEQAYEPSKSSIQDNYMASSSDSRYQQSYERNDRNPDFSQFENTNPNFNNPTSGGINHRIPAQNYDNAGVSSSVTECGEHLHSNYKDSDSSYTFTTSNQYEKSYETHKKYEHNTNEDSVQNRETKQYSYKQHYVDKRNKSFKSKYTNKNKRKKGGQDAEENASPFPRISKVTTCWEEFKHEAELQSTAEYLMNGPAKVLWNNNIVPLVAPSEHLTKESVFGSLSIIGNVDDAESCLFQPPAYGRLDFDVYLPTTNYSRYDPGPPSLRIKVVRCKDPTPTLGYEEKIPIHYAVVDNGRITFYSFSNVNLPNYT